MGRISIHSLNGVVSVNIKNMNEQMWILKILFKNI